MLLSMMAAFVLLAEAMAAVVFARSWHLSWWEWNVLMLVAAGLVVSGARIQWHEERFADLYLSDTVAGTRDMSVLFADLAGFTTFSEKHTPREVTAMLNAYFEVAVPSVVDRFGGDVDRIIGDALMVTFNKRGTSQIMRAAPREPVWLCRSPRAGSPTITQAGRGSGSESTVAPSR